MAIQSVKLTPESARQLKATLPAMIVVVVACGRTVGGPNSFGGLQSGPRMYPTLLRRGGYELKEQAPKGDGVDDQLGLYKPLEGRRARSASLERFYVQATVLIAK